MCRQGGNNLATALEVCVHIRVLALVGAPQGDGSREVARCCSQQLPAVLQACRDLLGAAGRGLDKKADAKLAWLLGMVASLLSRLPPTSSVATAQVIPLHRAYWMYVSNIETLFAVVNKGARLILSP